MRKHGWQLPYHPLQVVAVSVFLALGFAFYVFFAPFVGGKLVQYVVMGLYTPLVTCVFFLYIWCAATDPGDPGVFESKKYRHRKDNHNKAEPKESKQGDSVAHHASARDKSEDESVVTVAAATTLPNGVDRETTSWCDKSCSVVLLGLWPFSCLCSPRSSEKQSPKEAGEEDGMFYCSLCEVEVLKYSKHCRVCDKCVDSFDHHCRWINNCIGKRNYRRFFVLMISALLLLILQWSIGVLVLILCFIRRKQFSVEITSKLGSSFSLAPFVVVVASCTFLAIIATLPLAQLFFFHVLLIKKGISTYDYIIALREQDQQTVGQQSPQMSSVSSFTALSSTSSFNAFHRGGWCTPPRLFLEDQFDVVPPEISMSSVNSAGRRMMPDESTRKRNAGTVKISPWALARLNTEEVSKAAAQARKKSRVLQPVVRREKPLGKEMNNSFSHGSSQMVMWPDNRRRTNKRVRLPMELPLEPLAKVSVSVTDSNSSELAPETSTSLAPLQLEARSAFRPSQTTPTGIVASPDSSLDSPDLHPFRISTSGADESQGISYVPAVGTASQKGIQLSRSTSDGYDASGGEDSDRVPSRIVHRTSNWASLIVGSDDVAGKPKASSSVGLKDDTRQI